MAVACFNTFYINYLDKLNFLIGSESSWFINFYLKCFADFKDNEVWLRGEC